MDMDAGVDGRWMTYAELAEVRRIDKTSALKLAIRRKWTRRKDNHGTMQVCVPLDWAAPRDTGTHGDVDRGVDLSTIVRPLEAAISALQVQLDRAEATRIAAEARAEAADRRADDERARADRAEAASQQAAQAAEERSRADAARRALGRWSRLRAAWRGE